MSKAPDDGSWGTYLRRAMDYARIPNAAELHRRSGISESQISRWLRDQGAPDIETLRKVAKTLRRPVLEVVVAAGHLTSEEARLQDAPTVPEPVGSRDAILTDQALSEAGRAMLLAAYDAATSEDQGSHLIRRAGLGERTVKARARARQDATPEKRPPQRRVGEAQ
jgi:transcriptional regulator with XRE-family HTH domain